MTVKDLMNILRKAQQDGKVYVSFESALVEMKEENIRVHPWGVTFA